MIDTHISRQLTLPVRLDDAATFDNFYLPENSPNAELLSTAATRNNESFYIWGEEGSGVTHILQAFCHQAQNTSHTAIYLPFSEINAGSAKEIFVGLEGLDLICLDDLQSVVGNSDWEEQLFHLFNRCMLSSCQIVFGANLSPRNLAVSLADLQSRLNSVLVHRLEKLSDEETAAALVFRARRRGMEMPKNVADYLITRHSRSLGDQFRALDTLDRASLAEQRKLTIPFVKSVLEG